MATKVIGKYKGFVVEAETFVADGKMGLKIVSMTNADGKSVAKAKSLVGKTFPSVIKAGVESLDAIRDIAGLGPSASAMRVVFFEEGAKKPINAREFVSKGATITPSTKTKTATKPAAKAAKAPVKAKSKRAAAPVVEDDEDEDEEVDLDLADDDELDALDEITDEDDEDEEDEEDEAPAVQPTRRSTPGRATKTAATAAPVKGKKAARRSRTPRALSYSIFKDLSDGRLFCSACSDAFTPGENGSTADKCPKGHTTADFRDVLLGVDGSAD